MKYVWEQPSRYAWFAKNAENLSETIASISDYSIENHHPSMVGVYGHIASRFLNAPFSCAFKSLEETKEAINVILKENGHLEVTEKMKVML